MSEFEAILGVHRLIDRAVQEDPSLTDVVGQLFPCYREGATGWTDAFARLLVENGNVESDEQIFGEVDDSIDHFVEIEPAHAWAATRRLQLLAALSRAHPDHAPGGREAERLQSALGHHLDPEMRSDDAAQSLHELLATPGELTHETWTATLGGRDTASDSLHALQGHPAPCSGELIEMQVAGDEKPVTCLRTWTERDDRNVTDMGNLLDPSRWPDCPGFWCEMVHEGDDGDIATYLEKVATDCSGGNWMIQTRLEFLRSDYTDGWVALQYWLSDDGTAPADGLVEVDEGSILVRPKNPDGSGVIVSTTKRIRFNGPMDGAHLAMTACALGWDGAGDRFMFGCTEGDTT